MTARRTRPATTRPGRCGRRVGIAMREASSCEPTVEIFPRRSIGLHSGQAGAITLQWRCRSPTQATIEGRSPARPGASDDHRRGHEFAFTVGTPGEPRVNGHTTHRQNHCASCRSVTRRPATRRRIQRRRGREASFSAFGSAAEPTLVAGRPGSPPPRMFCHRRGRSLVSSGCVLVT